MDLIRHRRRRENKNYSSNLGFMTILDITSRSIWHVTRFHRLGSNAAANTHRKLYLSNRTWSAASTPFSQWKIEYNEIMSPSKLTWTYRVCTCRPHFNAFVPFMCRYSSARDSANIRCVKSEKKRNTSFKKWNGKFSVSSAAAEVLPFISKYRWLFSVKWKEVVHATESLYGHQTPFLFQFVFGDSHLWNFQSVKMKTHSAPPLHRSFSPLFLSLSHHRHGSRLNITHSTIFSIQKRAKKRKIIVFFMREWCV